MVFWAPDPNQTTRPQWGDFDGTSSHFIPDPHQRHMA